MLAVFLLLQDDVAKLSLDVWGLLPEQLPCMLRQELVLWVLRAQAAQVPQAQTQAQT